MIKNPVKKVVVRCLILCSKFAEKSFVGWALPDPLQFTLYSAPTDPLAGSWGKGAKREDGRAGGGEKGRGRKGQRRRRSGLRGRSGRKGEREGEGGVSPL